LLVLTGMGEEKARQASKLVLDKYPVSAVISTGFGGALNEKTKIGDIVVCSRLVCGEDPVREQNHKKVLESDIRLVSISRKTLEDSGTGFITGAGVTVPYVSSTPENKLALGKQFEADMVEMESYWIGKIAAEKKLPFIEVRSIFDGVQDDLSLLSRIIPPDGKVKPMTALADVISHPERMKTLAYYAGNAKKAGRNLTVFLRKLIDEMS